jgi:hypothetical protein
MGPDGVAFGQGRLAAIPLNTVPDNASLNGIEIFAP